MKTIQMFINGHMDKQNVYIHVLSYYSVIKRTEVQTQTTTWMNLENILMKEASDISMIPFI